MSDRPYRRTSPIWLLPRRRFHQLVKRSHSVGSILAYFGLKNYGNNTGTLQKRLTEENLLSELPRLREEAKRHALHTLACCQTIPLSQILVKNSTYAGHLRKRLLHAGQLEERCIQCGQGPEWQGKKLILVLDHINGVRNDNRRKNLRLLCPNCNSQTKTFAGRNKKYSSVS